MSFWKLDSDSSILRKSRVQHWEGVHSKKTQVMQKLDQCKKLAVPTIVIIILPMQFFAIYS